MEGERRLDSAEGGAGNGGGLGHQESEQNMNAAVEDIAEENDDSAHRAAGGELLGSDSSNLTGLNFEEFEPTVMRNLDAQGSEIKGPLGGKLDIDLDNRVCVN